MIINYFKTTYTTMKKIKFFVLMTVSAAGLLTACTSESDNSPSATISYESIKAAEQVPVTFGTYLGEQAVTRAGTAGSISNAENLVSKGNFGVFAYYTNAAYNSSTAPNFMYNQLVSGTEITPSTDPKTYKWSYTPVKYWPNDWNSASGNAVDGQTPAATGTKASYLSFFAYAPYVAVTASSGVPTTSLQEDKDGDGNDDTEVGIISLTGNTTNGDPTVTYTVATDPRKSVDLMWGVAGTTGDNVLGSANPVTTDAPFINQTKQKTGGNIKFKFKHALARLGITIHGAFDEVSTTSNDVDTYTRITVAQVELLGTNFYTAGTYNLYTGNWENSTGLTSTTDPFVINTQLNSDIKDQGSTKTNLDKMFAAAASGGITGVTKNEVSLYNGTIDTHHYMLIPSSTTTSGTTNTSISGVKITYYVNTVDANLKDGYSRVENVITKNFPTAITLAAGNAYKFKLGIGMTTIKLDAEVATWTDTDHEVWLPINVQ